MSNWYHVVCFHKGKHRESQPVHVCDIEDDGGEQARGHDRLTEWRGRSGISLPDRDIGTRLRAHNRTSTAHWMRVPGADPDAVDPWITAMANALEQKLCGQSDLARVDIEQIRNQPGHKWQLQCGVCKVLAEASDENLARALNQIRLYVKMDTTEITLQEQYATDAGNEWGAAEHITLPVVRLKDLTDEVNNPGVSKKRAQQSGC